MRGKPRAAIIVRVKRSHVLFGGLRVAQVAPQRRPLARKAAPLMGLAATVFFFLIGDLARVPWLVVVLSLAYVAFLLRHEPLDMLHPPSKGEAFREGLFAFGFTSLLMFSIGNFSIPEAPTDRSGWRLPWAVRGALSLTGWRADFRSAVGGCWSRCWPVPCRSRSFGFLAQSSAVARVHGKFRLSSHGSALYCKSTP